MNANSDVLLEVEGLRKYFPIQKGFIRKTVGYVKAVDDVNLRVRRWWWASWFSSIPATASTSSRR